MRHGGRWITGCGQPGRGLPVRFIGSGSFRATPFLDVPARLRREHPLPGTLANDERGLRGALSACAQGRNPARDRSRAMVRPLMRATGHLPGVIRFAGPRSNATCGLPPRRSRCSPGYRGVSAGSPKTAAARPPPLSRPRDRALRGNAADMSAGLTGLLPVRHSRDHLARTGARADGPPGTCPCIAATRPGGSRLTDG